MPRRFLERTSLDSLRERVALTHSDPRLHRGYLRSLTPVSIALTRSQLRLRCRGYFNHSLTPVSVALTPWHVRHQDRAEFDHSLTRIALALSSLAPRDLSPAPVPGHARMCLFAVESP